MEHQRLLVRTREKSVESDNSIISGTWLLTTQPNYDVAFKNGSYSSALATAEADLMTPLSPCYR